MDLALEDATTEEARVSGRSDYASLHALCTVDAKAAIEYFADTNGVSLAALVEAIGQDLIDEMQADSYAVDTIHRDWVKRARAIDVARRKRKRNNGAA